jgi:signal peptidase I
MATHPKPERHWTADWAVTILIFLFGTTTVLQAFVVPSGSMEGTLLVGDHLFVDKLSYAPAGSFAKNLLPYQEVRRGDIIVFRYPLDIQQNYVKRVAGIPGDRIRIVDKVLHINGKPMREPYKVVLKSAASNYLTNFPQSAPDLLIYDRGKEMLRDHVVNGELIVPPGQYFALGDNRDNSADSRFWGFVPRENIIGKPAMVWWSYDAGTERLADRNIAPTERLADRNIDPEHLKDIALNFFSKTRWRRTLLLMPGHRLE